MPNRSNAHDTAQIRLALLRRLSRTIPKDARTLHEALTAQGFQRSKRTIERTLKQMRDAGEVWCDDRSVPFSYRLPKLAQVLAVGQLTPQESLLLHLAQKHMDRLLPKNLKRVLNDFFEQAQRNLSVDANTALEREWIKKVRSVDNGMPMLPAKIVDGVLEAVSEALYANHWLDIEYRNPQGKTTSANVMPLGLFQQGPGLYLVCRFEGYEDEVSLALHRIRRARDTESPIKRPKDFDLEKFDRDGKAHFGLKRQIHLSFRITKSRGQHLMETPLSKDQRVTETEDDKLEIHATVPDTLKLKWWLAGFEDAVSDIRREVLAAAPEGAK